jgi:superfamily II DNA or RNA helicase
MLGLLHDLLKAVSWQEALARACAELLEGTWAERYLQGRSYAGHALWPSQQAGIAEALWVIQSVGSVLVADATGSGKTKMGAHLVRAVRDRLWSTGRVHRDITALVGPPAVIDQWEREALFVGLSISKVSHGLLSRSGDTEHLREELAVRDAQILAVDEAHNFLNNSSKRTRQVRESLADNVLLFTATPISRGASDLLNLVGLLGPDNFHDRTLDILKRLDRGRVFDRTLSEEEATVLRREIQRFTVRRTKTQINEMVDQNPDAYVHPVTGKVCRYPIHEARKYSTGETKEDADAADNIRELTGQFLGVAQLEELIAVPSAYRAQYTDDQWLQARLRSSRALARHHVIEALRSSRAALVEHVCGTTAAGERFGLSTRFKPNDTGDVLQKIRDKIERGAPEIPPNCMPPEWMTGGQQWNEACEREIGLYEQIVRLADQLSSSREETKADLLRKLCRDHEKVLVFEHHPITLAVMESLLGKDDLGTTKVFLAASKAQKKSVIHAFAPEAKGRAIAMCSDAMNEGLNLQAASCMVHLDLPTTLRVAEQRVGRVDRMDSPHPSIEVWWPNDGVSFATRAYERLLPWDGIRDALDPVRQLIFGNDPLISENVYSEWRESTHRVLSRVAPVTSARPWAFFAVSAASHGAPRWILIESDGAPRVITDLNEIADRLRVLLGENPESRPLDQAASEVLGRFLRIASKAERQLLPRRMLRALEQMSRVLKQWARQAQGVGDETRATQWMEIERLVSDGEVQVDPHLVAEGWLGLVAPVFEEQREESRHARYIQLKDIQTRLIRSPLSYERVVDAFVDLPLTTPLERRVSACIVGVPAAEQLGEVARG